MHTLSLTEQGTTLHAEGDLLVVRRGEAVLHRVRAAELDQVLVFGRIELTSGALALLLHRGIDVALLTARGNFRGRLVGRQPKNVALRLAQYQRVSDPAFCLRVARRVVAAKIKHQRDVLLRAQRRLQDEPLALALGQLRLLGERIEAVGDLDVLRGLEGQAAAVYFGQFDKLLRNDRFRFAGRTRRPPRDPVNACLSFGYAVLGTVIETEIYRCALDPQLGFFHQPAFGRPSLMLDVLEEFRPLVDLLVVRLVNRRQLGPADFEQRTGQSLAEVLADEAPSGEPGEPIDALPGQPTPAPTPQNPETTQPVVGVYLNQTGRKVFLAEFFRRLRERMDYPPRDAALELRDIVRQQIYHLARVIEGDQPDYLPFVPG
jgi:CRISPR-associated protein Cas1